MGIAGKKSLTSKRALAASALAAAVILIGLSTPRIYDRYKAYIAEPSNPYRHSPLPDLPPLGERVSGIDRGRTITEVQIPPSTNSNAPNAVTGWVVGTPEQIESAGIETEPDARFKKPSLPFPESTAVWHIDAHMGQPLADVTFVDVGTYCGGSNAQFADAQYFKDGIHRARRAARAARRAPPPPRAAPRPGPPRA